MNESAEHKTARVLPAVQACKKAIPFHPEEVEQVKLAYAVSFLYFEDEILYTGGRSKELEPYLDKYSVEESAGLIQLYKLEWRC